MSRRVLLVVSSLLISFCIVLTGCSGTPNNFHSVALTPSAPATLGEGQVLAVTATVANDSSGGGVTWSISPASGAGTLSAITKTTVNFNAPASVSAATVVTLTATSATYSSQSASLTITVEPHPTITTTSLPSASINAAYSATAGASGGVAPFTWSIASGALPGGLSLSASTSNSVVISGIPAAQGSFTFTIKVTDSTSASASQQFTIKVSNLAIATASPLPAGTQGAAYNLQLGASGGTPPYRWSLASGSNLPTGLALSSTGVLSGTPTVQGTGTFLVVLTDSESPAASVTRAFSLTIGGTGGASLLSGNYAFEFSGFNSAGGVVSGGSFQADGAGHITGGLEDFNTITTHDTNQTFSGTYTLGSDNRGSLVFSSLAGSPTYAFAIDATGAHGRFVGFDASGIRGSGKIEKQSLTSCAFNTIGGEYAVGISGNSAALGGFSAGPVAFAGRFTATPPPGSTGQGSIGNGEVDANTPGFVTLTQQTLSGSYQSTTQAGRCMETIQPSGLPGVTFSVYPVSASEFFLVETDTVNASTPFLTIGMMRQQIGYPFTGPAGGFTGTSIGAMTGEFFNTSNVYVPDLAVVSMTASGLNGFSMTVTENRAGAVATSTGTANFANADSFGRVATNLISPIVPVFYMINQNEAFAVGEIAGDPFFGIFQPQSAGPFSASTLKANFQAGTLAPSTSAVRDVAAQVTLDGVQSITGTEDESTSSANTTQALSGTYAVNSAVAGSGTVTLTAPGTLTGSFYIVSPTQFIMVTTTAGDTDPVLMIFGN